MDISYEYQIANMDVAKIDGKDDVVVAVHYRVIAKIDGANIHPVHSGVVNLDAPVDGFTAFEQLTKKQVEGWVKSAIDTKFIEENLRDQIGQEVNPSIQIVTTSKTLLSSHK